MNGDALARQREVVLDFAGGRRRAGALFQSAILEYGNEDDDYCEFLDQHHGACGTSYGHLTPVQVDRLLEALTGAPHERVVSRSVRERARLERRLRRRLPFVCDVATAAGVRSVVATGLAGSTVFVLDPAGEIQTEPVDRFHARLGLAYIPLGGDGP